MKAIVTLFLLFSLTDVFAVSDTLLGQDGHDIDLSQTFVQQKQLQLDDAFLIQLYSAWKSSGVMKPEQERWLHLIFDKKNELALKYLDKVSDEKLVQIKQASELYLLYQLGFFQTFLNRWIATTTTTDLLKTQMGIALDQIVGKESSRMLLNYGFLFNDQQLKALENTEKRASRVNYSLQAFKALRAGKGALPWIAKLGAGDPLRMYLAQSALLEFAREGKLGASAKLIKKVIEPYIEESTDREEIALYYMTLARLLYQAGAYPEARQYYYTIPETSRYYLSARTEALWLLLRTKDYAKAKGELASLDLGLFNDQFYPEVYLASSISNVLMCQFSDAKKAFTQFIDRNKKWVKIIEGKLAEKNPEPTFMDRSLNNLELLSIAIEEEQRLMERSVVLSKYTEPLNKLERDVLAQKKLEITRQWEGRRQMLSQAIYKMKFVKVEFISRMRELALQRRDDFVDRVSTYNAAIVKDNHLSFPKDEMPWGDEVFNMSAEVVNQCQKLLNKRGNNEK